jgi:hypothetical protein
MQFDPALGVIPARKSENYSSPAAAHTFYCVCMCVVRVWHSLHKPSTLQSHSCRWFLGLKGLGFYYPRESAGPPRRKFNFDLLNWNTSGGRITSITIKAHDAWMVLLRRAPKLIQHELSLSSADTINNLSHLRRGSILISLLICYSCLHIRSVKINLIFQFENEFANLVQ